MDGRKTNFFLPFYDFVQLLTRNFTKYLTSGHIFYNQITNSIEINKINKKKTIDMLEECGIRK